MRPPTSWFNMRPFILSLRKISPAMTWRMATKTFSSASSFMM